MSKVMTLPTPQNRQSRRFLEDLRREIAEHPAVNHLFLNRLATAPFSREDYRVFAENHIPLVCVFTSYLERLLVRAPDSEAKLWIAKVLVDEYGEGSDGDDHATLYGGFLRSCGGDPAEVLARPVPKPALRFIRTHQRLVATEPFLVGLGAVGPGHEWAIPSMFESVIPGLRRAGFEEEEIHYFTLHVEQDEDHGSWLEEALHRYASTDEAQHQIRKGAIASMDARARFWDGVQRAVVTWRQPHSIRQDGVRGRAVPAEIAITLWDSMQLSRRLESRLRAWRAALRPRLDELVASNRDLPASPFAAARTLLEGARP